MAKNLDIARRVLEVEIDALTCLLERLGNGFEQAIEILLRCSGRPAVTGIGKSGIVASKIAATLASTGTPAYFLHPAEAQHGDLGMLMRRDVLVALSYGGETAEVLNLLPHAKRLDIPVIALTGSVSSTLAQAADCLIDIGVPREACPLNLAPTASTTAMIAIGDALAMALLERRGFQREDFARLHPGGTLGKKFKRVSDLMHQGKDVPRVSPSTAMSELIYEISRKGFGMTAVVEENDGLVGIITDGDLRRLMQSRQRGAFFLAAADCMTPHPVTVARSELAAAALHIMEQHRITSLPVVGNQNRLEGVVHLHDLWTLQLF